MVAFQLEFTINLGAFGHPTAFAEVLIDVENRDYHRLSQNDTLLQKRTTRVVSFAAIAPLEQI
jgi:hypothetical protein